MEKERFECGMQKLAQVDGEGGANLAGKGIDYNNQPTYCRGL